MKNSILLPFIFCISIFLLACSGDTEPSQKLKQYRIEIGSNEYDYKEQMLYVLLALQVYRLHVGTFPSEENNLQALIAEPKITEGTGTWDGPYVEDQKVFQDPWGRKISYGLEEDGSIDLRSLGPDGVRSDDDILAKELFKNIYKELDKLDQFGPVPVPGNE